MMNIGIYIDLLAKGTSKSPPVLFTILQELMRAYVLPLTVSDTVLPGRWVDG